MQNSNENNIVPKVSHSYFLIEKFLLFLKERFGLHPLIGSCLFGAFFLLLNAFMFMGGFVYDFKVATGYLIATSWLLIGPYLIYYSDKIVDELWPELTTVLPLNEIIRLQKYEKLFHRWYHIMIAVPIYTAFLVIIYLYVYPVNSLTFTFVYAITWLVLTFLASIGVLGISLVILLITDIAKCDLNLNPLSPDRFGGIGFLGNFAIKGTMLFSSGALTVPLAIELTTYRFPGVKELSVVFPVIFSILVILSFIVPLFGLNAAATRSKKRMLEEAGREYKALLKKYKTNFDEKLGIRILVYQSYFDEVEKMKEYPWDVRTFLKLVGSALFPILLSLLKPFLLSLGIVIL